MQRACNVGCVTDFTTGNYNMVLLPIVCMVAGADPGVPEWWGCMTNAREFLGHAHFIKTTPIFLLPSGAAACLQTTLPTVWRVVFTTCLELGHYS